MSISGKKWVIQNENEQFNLIAKLLENRGITNAEKADLFFRGSFSHLHDPYLLKDMDLAVSRLKSAIAQKESVVIFGDYDVDGITATALLFDFLRKVGADVSYTLPHREKDGYGLKKHFIQQFKEKGVRLIVTVDCGTSSLQEIEMAYALGMEVIVTDHHGLPDTLPSAEAIVNPHRPDCPYPNKAICGSSIAYKLVEALAESYLSPDERKCYLQKQLGVVALGVVGDCMELKDENRILVKEGLRQLAAGSSDSIQALMEAAGLSGQRITSTTLGFQIAPRINAAGRIDHPEHAFELLMGQLEKAYILNELNEKRRHMTKIHTCQAREQVDSWPELPNIIVVHHPDWPAGLLGLIASKMAEIYHRPAIALQEQEDKWVASMRSVNDFNITETLRETLSPLCLAYGGHAMAGGFTLKKEYAETFKTLIKKVGDQQLKKEELIKILPIDCEAKSHELTFEMIRKMEWLEPFGNSNPEPTFVVKKVSIQAIKPLGKDQDHLKFILSHENKTLNAIAFRFGKHLDKIDAAQTYDIACRMGINQWNGREELQLQILDLKVSQC